MGVSSRGSEGDSPAAIVVLPVARSGSLPGVRAFFGLGRAAGLVLPLLLVAPPASPQPAAEPTLAHLALMWASGDFRGPLICEIDGDPRRGSRRIEIRPQRRRAYRPQDEVVFHPLPEGARCRNELGGPAPQIEGTLRIGLDAHARPDTARRDFQEALRRDGGFAFEVTAGTLTIRDAGEAEPRTLRLRGANAHLRQLRRGSAGGQLLAEYRDLPKRELRIEARDGTELVFHLVQLPPSR